MVKKVAQTKAKAQGNGIQADAKFIAELTGKKGKNAKKQVNTPAKVVPPKKVLVKEEEDDEESDNEELEDDSGADVKAEQDSDDGEEDDEMEGEDDDDDEEDDEMEGEDDDDDEEDEEEEDDDDEEEDLANVKLEEDGNDDEEMDSDEPDEVPIGKKTPTKGGIPQIKNGDIPADVPNEQVIYVGNVPPNTKQIDIVQVFAKYGSINTIKVFGYKPNAKKKGLFIAFNTAAAANAALAANGKAKIQDSILEVTLRRAPPAQRTQEVKDRTIFVKNLKVGTTEEQLQEHFAECGSIVKVNIVQRKSSAYAFVQFATTEAAEEARKLHNSIINGVTVSVFRNSEKSDSQQNLKDSKRTILVKNTPELECISVEKISSIFSKCGEISFVDILCKKNVLAFVTFKDEKSVANAFKMNGTTVEGLELSIVKYEAHGEKPKTTIFVQNVKPGVTEDELRELFIKCGDIESVFTKSGFAIIKFQETDAFCKSFLLNESLLKKQMIFIEPYSDKKQSMLKQKKNGPPRNAFAQRKPFNQNRKRPIPPFNAGSAKKFKKNP